MDPSAGLLIAGVIGATMGAVVTWLWRYSERRETEVPEVVHAVPPGAEAVLSVLSSSAVIVDAADTVVQASAPAVAMGLVLVLLFFFAELQNAENVIQEVTDRGTVFC